VRYGAAHSGAGTCNDNDFSSEVHDGFYANPVPASGSEFAKDVAERHISVAIRHSLVAMPRS